MEIDALRFSRGEEGFFAVRLRGEKELENDKKSGSPLVYVVRKGDLVRLRTFKGLIEDRGKKHPAKGLSKIMLNRKKIPIIDGGFTGAGRLISGVSKLLSNAKDEKNLFIIGADERLFSRLWEEGRGLEETEPCAEDAAISGIAYTGSLNELLDDVPVPPGLEKEFIGKSREAELVRKLIIRAAGIDDPALILGDTGTGKEIVARQIHEQGSRKNYRFVAVNCGAISPYLFESELFGHKRGIAHGVQDRKGLWREAGDGTLFLDEVGDLSLDHQKRILRAIQERRVRPVGDDNDYPVNARIIAATNRDLFSMMQTGQFREDLYYRLCGFLIKTRPLREHKEDIPLLAKAIWEKRTAEGRRIDLPDDIISMLKSYDWPGNVRELKKALANLHSLFHGAKRLCADHLKAVFRLQGQNIAEEGSASSRRRAQRYNVESLRHLLRATEVIRAAEITIKPVIEKKKIDKKTVHAVHSALQYRLDELKRLCEYPLRFNSQAVFDKIKQLESKLMFFASLLKEDAGDALRHWRENPADEFSSALSAAHKEIEKAIRASSG